MPIQPMSINYNPIPDIEDVNSVDGSLNQKAKSSHRSFGIVCACVVAMSVLAWCYLYLPKPVSPRSPDLFQTSINNGDYISTLDASELFRRGFKIGSFNFGNRDCTPDAIQEGKCVDLISPPSKIFIDTSTTFQSIIGFGGAFTEAAANNFYKLPSSAQDKVMELYFGESGIGYSLGRVHINSCDFSLQSYCFDNVTNDFDLVFFDTEVTHDNAEMLPMMRRAMQVSNRNINILASPWSPPSWMKLPSTPGGHPSMTGSATPNGLIDTQAVKAAWALYISKFITAYEYKGVPIWAITPQNEPEFPAPWEACAYNSSFETDFIGGYLGPIVKRDHPDVLILAFDHNKDHLETWTRTVFSDPVAAKYVDGMAFHWYAGAGDRMLDGTYGYNSLNSSYHFAPEKIFLATEGCSCPNVLLGDTLRAERLAHDVIFDLLHHAHGWIDWNLLVNYLGGPNHLGNYCDAPIIANSDFTDVNIQPKYYYFGHISKYVEPGSVRVKSSVVGNFGFAAVDPNIRAGIELGIFPCEKSSRQQWKLTVNNTVGLLLRAIDSVASTLNEEVYVNLCVGTGDFNRPYLRVVICDSVDENNRKGNKITDIEPPFRPFISKFNSLDQWVDTVTGWCVGLADDVESTDFGTLLQLAPCEVSGALAKPAQRFRLDDITGEVFWAPQTVADEDIGDAGTPQQFSFGQKMCLTAGWPFLTAVGFLDTAGRTVVVAMNEASIGTDIVLTDSKLGNLRYGINSRAIQTLLY